MSLCLFGQDEINVKFYEKEISESEIRIYCDNSEFFPVSVELKLELKGLTTDHRNGDVVVLKPREDNQLLAVLSATPGRPWQYRTSAQYAVGNVLLEDFDTNFVYELPFARGSREVVSQGYLGKMSHQNEYAIDFNMKEGTPVFAMRGGLVIKVVDSNDKSCPDRSCMQFNNVITIQHDDGTYAEYAHLKQHSAGVRVGDEIAAGTYLADSGRTGWTTGPHLHIAIFVPAFGKRKTIPTLFRIGDGKSDYLVERKSYYRS